MFGHFSFYQMWIRFCHLSFIKVDIKLGKQKHIVWLSWVICLAKSGIYLMSNCWYQFDIHNLAGLLKVEDILEKKIIIIYTYKSANYLQCFSPAPHSWWPPHTPTRVFIFTVSDLYFIFFASVNFLQCSSRASGKKLSNSCIGPVSPRAAKYLQWHST